MSRHVTQSQLGTRAATIIEVDGLKFKDLDGDGQLSPYEDWRLTPSERARDLVGRMTVEEKAGLMIIGSHHPGYSKFLPNPKEGQLLNDEDVWRTENPITGVPFLEPVLVTSATDAAINQRHQRYLIVRDNLSPEDLTTWTNAVQEVAERSRLGIPVVFTSNPRNHVALVAQFGVNESAGVFSEWPGELGLAALRDPELIADYIGAVVRGMQGPELSSTSVATTIKHFPGGGVRLDGHDPHFAWGQTNEYPTENALYQYHLPPFQAAVDAGCSSIMPYYARPMNNSAPQLEEQLWINPTTQFEEVAFAYNRTFLQDLLREKMGFEGYINSDSGVIDAMMWGVEKLSEPERFAAAVRAGTAIFSDMANPARLLEAVTEIFQLGLFENPYVTDGAAIGAEEVAAMGRKAQLESVTLLRNDASLLPLDRDKALKVYAWVTGRTKIDQVQRQLEEAFGEVFPQVELVADEAEADLAFVWARPEIALFEDDLEGVSLSVDPRDNGVDVDHVREIQTATPTILAVNFTNPWILSELEPGAAAVVGTFEIKPELMLASLAGEGGGPKGKLPLTVPVSAEVIAQSPRDVPGKFLGDDYVYVDSTGVAYAYGHGLTF
ncbi:glycosyl hydrolase family 3 C-terminal domain protein [Corynebacterium efficiens YS-314]|uniref:beta-glucosidase n=1 Tax=Corynebacterium efficiens (strain DSM 44549 / YS-314 / AJ 12310 / JCM 11189 / NBRC 100395) TaxID=196164 RepID=Q8FSQ3_COREF|nr:glycoside hydrolase family 3 N-terminal domain-containing protein [Corynebacterium efficiens]EEW50893.1 glycosyl hydrolase family 3 C-terminal domain protein [Corynebacterium efficiens YS-314]BAC17139.1 putative beta-glucosidase [Corynebacterium efficiens YS-314]